MVILCQKLELRERGAQVGSTGVGLEKKSSEKWRAPKSLDLQDPGLHIGRKNNGKMKFKLFFHGPLAYGKNALLPGFLLFQGETCARSQKKKDMKGNCMSQCLSAVSSKHSEQ